jgi:hypothetical protein
MAAPTGFGHSGAAFASPEGANPFGAAYSVASLTRGPSVRWGLLGRFARSWPVGAAYSFASLAHRPLARRARSLRSLIARRRGVLVRFAHSSPDGAVYSFALLGHRPIAAVFDLYDRSSPSSG